MYLHDGYVSCQNSCEQVRERVPILHVLMPISYNITGCYGEESFPKYQELLVTTQDWIIKVILLNCCNRNGYLIIFVFCCRNMPVSKPHRRTTL